MAFALFTWGRSGEGSISEFSEVLYLQGFQSIQGGSPLSMGISGYCETTAFQHTLFLTLLQVVKASQLN